MATELYANVATTTVSSGGTTAPAGGTSEAWTVASSAPFPAAATGVSQFHVSDPAAATEMVLVTNVSGSTWTVTRGAESTTPVAHTAGFTIWLVVTSGDMTALATLASPALTGTPTAPTASALTNSTQLATTAYADSAVSVETGRAETAEALLAPKASPALTGIPTAPTAAALTSNTQLATTAYADTAVGAEKTRAQAAETLLAPLASPALTGTPTAPTKTALTNNTDLATTAYADAAVAVELARAEAAEALALPLTGGTMSGAIAMGSHKVTGLTNGSGAQDAAAFGQIPVIDSTAGDIQPLGASAVAGATGKTADAGHVHTAASGVTPVSAWTVWATGLGADMLNNTSPFSLAPSAGTIYYTATYIGCNCTLTGIMAGVGTTAGTDSWIVVLYNSAGTVVANSVLTGTAVSASVSSKQKIAFTGTVAVTGPGLYYIGIQSNGVTAKIQTYPNALEGFAAASKTGNSFGTLTLGTPTTTYTTQLGPVANTY